jgi:hypothetical protein
VTSSTNKLLSKLLKYPKTLVKGEFLDHHLVSPIEQILYIYFMYNLNYVLDSKHLAQYKQCRGTCGEGDTATL